MGKKNNDIYSILSSVSGVVIIAANILIIDMEIIKVSLSEINILSNMAIAYLIYNIFSLLLFFIYLLLVLLIERGLNEYESMKPETKNIILELRKTIIEIPVENNKTKGILFNILLIFSIAGFVVFSPQLEYVLFPIVFIFEIIISIMIRATVKHVIEMYKKLGA